MNQTVSSSEKEKTATEDIKNMERKIIVKFLVSKEMELANKALSNITTNITLDLTEVNVWIYAIASVIAGERHE